MMTTTASNMLRLLSLLLICSTNVHAFVTCPSHLLSSRAGSPSDSLSQPLSPFASAFTRSFMLKARKYRKNRKDNGRSNKDGRKKKNDETNGDEAYEPSSSEPMVARWKLQNDFYTFLNQCSIQSFLFLLKSMHDPQTVMWLKNFTQAAIQETEEPSFSMPNEEGATEDVAMPSGGTDDCRMLSYHGLNAMNMTLFPTWESYFVKLMESPIETYTIESSSSFIPDYDLDINPPRLCNRIVAVREQIAREFANDLKVLSKMGNETLLAHQQKMEEQRLQEENHQEEVVQPQHDPDDLDGREIKIERHNLMFLDLSVHSDYSPSPLRKGNFDLVKLLATQEAVHRLLNDPERQTSHGPANQYLHDFYTARLISHFDGNQDYGRADKFLQELLEASPGLRQANGETSMVDPFELAELVIAKRQDVALEWSMLAKLVPEEHVVIRRLQLDQLLMGSGSGSGQSFEDALKGGSSTVDTSKTMPLFVPPTSPSPFMEEIVDNEDEFDMEEDIDDEFEDLFMEERELVGFGGSIFGFRGTMNMTSVFE